MKLSNRENSKGILENAANAVAPGIGSMINYLDYMTMVGIACLRWVMTTETEEDFFC